jgi:hypothetical protein
MPNMKRIKKLKIMPSQWLMLEIFLSYVIFKGKKLMQWLESPFTTQRFRVWTFFRIIFFINKQNGWK